MINDDDTDENDGGDDDDNDKVFYSEHNTENRASFGLILAIDIFCPPFTEGITFLPILALLFVNDQLLFTTP